MRAHAGAGIEPASNTSNGTAPVEVAVVADQLDAAASETHKTDWTKETLSIVVVGASGGLSLVHCVNPAVL